MVLVTGATDGLGLAISLHYARLGWCVLIHGRRSDGAGELVSALRRIGAPSARYYCADFGSLREVRRLASDVAETEPALQLLLNNAGVGVLPERRLTVDGYDLAFQVNYLAPYLLSRRLAPLLARSGRGRIVNIASVGLWNLDFGDLLSERRWHGAVAYGRSKMALVMDTQTLARDLEPFGVAVNAIHPASLMPTKMTEAFAAQAMGPKAARLSRFLFARQLRKAEPISVGVRNVAAIAEPGPWVTGRLLRGIKPVRVPRAARNATLLRRLEEATERLCTPSDAAVRDLAPKRSSSLG